MLPEAKIALGMCGQESKRQGAIKEGYADESDAMPQEGG